MDSHPQLLVERVTAPAVEPLTLSEVKLYLRVEHEVEDDLIESLIVSAREAAETWTGRSLITQSQKLYAKELTHTILCLPRGPVQSIQTVELVDSEGESETLDSDLYRLHAARGILQLNDVPQADEVVVTYVAGYGDAATDVPSLIRQGMLQHIAKMYEDREAPRNAPELARALYQPYREMRL